ncbi:MAG TPA: ferritin-like domain-containing protein [Verrucomicrobiae bacterium]|nr:ferritin-like domain-containing protein [Verrucomicrobiae bacterium]
MAKSKKAVKQDNADIIRELCVAFAMELETVQNYIANAVHLDGVRSDVIKKALAADVPTELMHAQQLAQRIKTIGGRVPGSLRNDRSQDYLQPPENATDVVRVIKGVIRAEEAAIEQYNKIIRMCEGRDYVTQDQVIEILGGEEDHRREFMGFLREYQN